MERSASSLWPCPNFCLDLHLNAGNEMASAPDLCAGTLIDLGCSTPFCIDSDQGLFVM